MKRMILIAAALALGGCRHMRGEEIANTLITAAVIAIDLSQLPPPPPEPWCSDDETDPPHTCPGNGAGATPPPPPPEN